MARAIVFADGWFEWKKEGATETAILHPRANGQPIFMAAIGGIPFELR